MSNTKVNIKVNGEELKFWLTLLLFNVLLFVPLYVLSLDDSTFLPLFSGVESGNIYSYFKYIFIRANKDVFRLSADFVLVSLLIVFLLSDVLLFQQFPCLIHHPVVQFFARLQHFRGNVDILYGEKRFV